jgi:hypothetical protein
MITKIIAYRNDFIGTTEFGVPVDEKERLSFEERKNFRRSFLESNGFFYI